MSGKVSGESGLGLPGVTVSIKGTNRGTNTDVNGNYKLSATSNSTLVFSSIGYSSQEVKLGSQAVINISLSETTSTLDEVIVTTFGTAKKASFTGSSASLGAEKLAQRPITNIGQALEGISAGVTTTSTSGQPGSSPDVRIRGFGSISSSNSPLYVVDGVPYSASIANLNNDDIQSITVLKDAASTALYGARAANGVVMVTTKKGTKGKNSINVKYTKGFNTRALPEYDRVGPADYYPLMWEANRNNLAYRATSPVAIATANATASAGLGAIVGTGYNVYNVPFASLVGLDGKLNPSASLIYNADDLNWEKAIMHQGVRDEVNANFSGNNGKSDYFLSVSYLNDKGYQIKSDYDRFTARLNMNSQMTDWFKVGANLNTTITSSNQSTADGGTSFVNPFFFTRGIAPIYPVYAYDPASPGSFLKLENGNLRYDYGNLSALGLSNRPQYGGRHVVAETLLNENFFNRNLFGGRGFAEITFLKDFKFTNNVGIDITNANTIVFGNPEIGDGAPAGRASNTFENITNYNLSQLLTYNHTFGKHTVDALVGHENYNLVSNSLDGSRSQQILDGNYELINFTTTTNLTSQKDLRRVEGFFSRLNYDYDSKYFVSFSARRDGSSKFYQDKRWGTFYSGSAAWRLDQEDFMKELTFIDNMKLRASYGQTGNDGGISNYAWQPLYALGWNNATEPGILQSSLGSKTLEWETNTAMDVALEFGLFKNRLTGTFEYFDRQSTNLIFAVPLPLSVGIGTETRNIGSMYNRGVEIQLGYDVIRKKDFNWHIDLNATKLKNEITKMPQESKEIIDGTKKLKEGSSLYDYWLREYMGVNSETGVAEYRAVSYVASNSRITANGDTVTNNIANAKYRYHGTSIPDLTGSVSTSLRYKGFTLSALMVYQLGGKIYDAAYAGLMGAGYHNAKHVDILKRWVNPGDVTDVPRMDAGRTADFDAASSRWLIDGSFMNIRSVTLAYQLPRSVLSRFKIDNAQVYVSGENFLMLSRRSGMNVQQNFGGTTSNVYSPAKSLVLGLSFSL
ncbi:SusC/RagA family TonB-linked outer membrane protein [Sandaracinomonas limnophila]|uniref:SusC/RagA family TonB-linked outer membrane protein n=1 Tax=Sandaracinomonas limnophila TaxID=1862386 RepID=UPI0021D342D0|nr:TonB-dependent receptor [Sandaracinomonas limnophila]